MHCFNHGPDDLKKLTGLPPPLSQKWIPPRKLEKKLFAKKYHFVQKEKICIFFGNFSKFSLLKQNNYACKIFL